MSSVRFLRRHCRRGGMLLAALLLPAGALRAQDNTTTPDNAPASDSSNAPADNSSNSSDINNGPLQPYYPSNVEPGVQGLDRIRALPPDSFGDQPGGIPYSSVITPTGADVGDYNVLSGHPLVNEYGTNPKLGEAEGSVLFSPGLGNYTVPFIRAGSEPEDANIKAGPFYIKFHSLDGLVLYDDNYNGSENDRKSELLVLLRLNLTVIAQLSDNLQFAVSGDIGYLPLQNQFGVQSSIYGNLGLLAAGPLFAAQFLYNTQIAGWPVLFADDFRIGSGMYAGDEQDNFDLFQGDYLQRENDGRYVFASAANPGQTTRGDFVNSQESSLIYFSNTISAVTDRLLPDELHLTLRADHEDLWYNQDNRGLPPSRDDFYASLVSERENMRFKPYVSYEATYIQGNQGVTQTFRAGFFGPIDDQLFLRAEVGYFLTSHNQQNVLYRLDLKHDAGPYTTEHLVLDRDISYFDQEERTSEYYLLNQTLGPTLYGSLFLAHSSFQELADFGLANRTEDLGGVQLLWEIGPKTTLELAGIAEHQRYVTGQKDDVLTARAVLDRIITDTLSLQLLYEYQHVSESNPGRNYYENIVYLRIVKYLE